MSYFLFVDESGQDQRESPYEVLAGVIVQDRDLWNLVCELTAIEAECFGCRYSDLGRELKGRELLKTKTFRLAAQAPEMDPTERRVLAYEILQQGDGPTRERLTALGQAKLAYARLVLEACGRARCRVLASIVDRKAPRLGDDYLRKDYAFLFERFFYFLEDRGPETQGLVVFDELERSRSHLLIEQMSRYVTDTATGRSRSGNVIPEPFFVHSDLTTGIRMADLVAYLIVWSVRLGAMAAPAREELSELGDLVAGLRYTTERDIGGNPRFKVFGLNHITDLRPDRLQK